MEFKEALIGGAGVFSDHARQLRLSRTALDACNDPFPDETLKQMKSSDSVLLAAIGGDSMSLNALS
eukprot:765657-Hanusia_phi.AAC.1